MSIPLQDNDNKPSGVLVGNISMWVFENLLENAKYLPYAEVFFINPSGYVEFHSGNKYSENDNIADEKSILYPAAETILKSDEGYSEFYNSGRNWACSFSTVNSSGWKVLSLIDTQKLQGALNVMNHNTNSFIVSLGALCILIGSAACFSVQFNHNSTHKVERVKEITAGNLTTELL